MIIVMKENVQRIISDDEFSKFEKKVSKNYVTSAKMQRKHLIIRNL